MEDRSGGGGSSSSSGTKLSLGISRLSSSSLGSSGSGNAGPWVSGRGNKSVSVGSDSPDAPASDPHYIMQLVSDVRKFADVLLQLKEVFNSKGMGCHCQHLLLSYSLSFCYKGDIITCIIKAI